MCLLGTWCNRGQEAREGQARASPRRGRLSRRPEDHREVLARTSLPPSQNLRMPLPWSAYSQIGGGRWGKEHRCPKKWCTRENISSIRMPGQRPTRLFSQALRSSAPMSQELLLTCRCVYPACPTWSRRRSLKGESGKCYCNQPQFTPCFEGKTHCLSTSQVSSLPGTGCVGNTNNSNQTETKTLNNDRGSAADGRTLRLFMKRHIFSPWKFCFLSHFLRKKVFFKNLSASTAGTPLCQLLLHRQECSKTLLPAAKGSRFTW